MNLKKAHKHSFRNKQEVLASSVVGCFYCRRVYAPEEIERWVDKGEETAICPHCSIDSVLGDQSGFPVDDVEFLKAMHVEWFCKGYDLKGRLKIRKPPWEKKNLG